MAAGQSIPGDDGGERRLDTRAGRTLGGRPGGGQRTEAGGVADRCGRGDQLAEAFGGRTLEGIAQVEAPQPAAAGSQRVMRCSEGHRPAGALGVAGSRALAVSDRQHELMQRRQAALRADFAEEALYREGVVARIGGDRFDLTRTGDAGRTGRIADGAADAVARIVVQPRLQRLRRAAAGVAKGVEAASRAPSARSGSRLVVTSASSARDAMSGSAVAR